MSKIIYVYNDEGCLGSDMVAEWVQRHLPDAKIQFVDAKQIKLGILAAKGPKALFVPGGESRFYNIRLAKKGRDAIRAFVEHGGIYYGICAGAYYAASEVKFKEGSQRVALKEKDGQLSLFGGIAIGEVHNYDGTGDPRYLANLKYSGRETKILYSRGPYFDRLTGAIVMASFAGRTNYPAVIKSKYGKGLAILSAIHPEYDSDKLKEVGLEANQENIDAFSEYLLDDIINQKRFKVAKNDASRGQQNRLYSFSAEFK